MNTAHRKVWTSCFPSAKSKLKIPHFTGVISVWTNWQEFQSVVQTMRWEEMALDDSDEKLAEIDSDIRDIRYFLDNLSED